MMSYFANIRSLPNIKYQRLWHFVWIVSGELWLGLEEIHQLTSGGSYSLHITLKDFDHKSYVAIYDQFQVIIYDDDW